MRRRGAVLIVAIGVLAVLAGLVVTFARSMRVEAVASANYAAQVQAEGVVRAGEHYAMAMLASQADQVLVLGEAEFEAIPVGEAGYFWIIRPNYDDPNLPSYGLMDEAAKLNISTATSEMLQYLPGMPVELADAIVDWRDEDDEVTGSGAESADYALMPNPYAAKNAAFESVEELLLVRGMTREFLYGTEMAVNGRFVPYGESGMFGGGGMVNTAGLDFDPTAYRGVYDYLTVYSTSTGTQQGGGGGGGGGGGEQTTTVRGRINLNTAPREVLRCIPGVSEQDVDAILSSRASAQMTDPTDTSWLDAGLAGRLGQYMQTGSSQQFSADVVGVSANGRGFKRVRVVIDVSGGTPVVVYRRDLTEFGWPLDPEILAGLRRGEGVVAMSSAGTAARRSM